MTDDSLSQHTLNTFCINSSEIDSPPIYCACLHLVQIRSRDTKFWLLKTCIFAAVLTSPHSSKLIEANLSRLRKSCREQFIMRPAAGIITVKLVFILILMVSFSLISFGEGWD